MDGGEGWAAGHVFIEARVVLHGAGAERIEPGVDRVVLLRQASEVAHSLRLAEPGESNHAAPLEAAEAVAKRRRLGKVDAAMPRRILLEDQRLFDLQPAVAADGFDRPRRIIGLATADGPAPIIHNSTSRKAASSRSMSSVVVISVAATRRRSATVPLSG